MFGWRPTAACSSESCDLIVRLVKGSDLAPTLGIIIWRPFSWPTCFSKCSMMMCLLLFWFVHVVVLRRTCHTCCMCGVRVVFLNMVTGYSVHFFHAAVSRRAVSKFVMMICCCLFWFVHVVVLRRTCRVCCIRGFRVASRKKLTACGVRFHADVSRRAISFS